MGAEESKVESIFYAALEKNSAVERAAYLDEACSDDSELRGRVELLLDAQPNLGRFLENDAVGTPTIDYPPPEQPGTMIGSYKLIEEIGEGGMGSVFMALQKEPVRRKVALKVIKPGMDSRQVVSRFEAERQALALMDHPNIARVFDGGATESGRPYFVMELVNGMPITGYCDRYRLTTNDRLELFSEVCRAVQHAHQKGIIHRDLKPSNILVTLLDGRAIPKVIDFGIAKAIRGHLTEESLVTHFAQMIGSPLYMSPEQAELSAADVDTRSDVYSLGILLYELLTGNTPFDRERMSSVSFDEFRRIIREEEPPRPSTRLSTLDGALDTVADKHHTDPRTLTRQLSGELDWIVMKALEKDRTRRYESASALAADIQRHLNDEPVEACPPSSTYKLRKLVRRHTVALTTALMVVAALLVGTAVSVWQAYEANTARLLAEASFQRSQREQARARANFDIARQALDQMYTHVARGIHSDERTPTELQRDILEQSLVFHEELTQENDASPLSLADQGAVLLKVFRTFHLLDQLKRSEAACRKAIKIYEELVARHADKPHYRLHLAQSWRYLAYSVERTPQSDTFMAHVETSVAVLEKLVEDHPTFAEGYGELGFTILHLAWGAVHAGDRATAEKIFRRSAELIEQSAALGNTSARLRRARGYNRKDFGKFLARENPRAAEEMLREAVAIAAAMVEEDPNDSHDLDELNNCYLELASALERMDCNVEANALCGKATASWQNLAGKYPRIIAYRMRLSHMLDRQMTQRIAAGDYAQAESLCRDVIEMRQAIRTASPSRRMEHPLADNHETLARILAHQHRFGDALVEAEQGLKLLEGLIATRPQDANFTKRLARQRHQVAKLILMTKIFDDHAAERARGLVQSAVDADPKRQPYWRTLWLANLRTGHWLGTSFSREFSEFAERNQWVQWSLAAANLILGRLEMVFDWLHPATTSRDPAATVPASSSE